jgi:hypothetical protein
VPPAAVRHARDRPLPNPSTAVQRAVSPQRTRAAATRRRAQSTACRARGAIGAAAPNHVPLAAVRHARDRPPPQHSTAVQRAVPPQRPRTATRRLAQRLPQPSATIAAAALATTAAAGRTTSAAAAARTTTAAAAAGAHGASTSSTAEAGAAGAVRLVASSRAMGLAPMVATSGQAGVRLCRQAVHLSPRSCSTVSGTRFAGTTSGTTTMALPPSVTS